MKTMKLKGTGKEKTVKVTIDGNLRTLYGRHGQTVYVHGEPDPMLGEVTISLHPDSLKVSVHRSYLSE